MRNAVNLSFYHNIITREWRADTPQMPCTSDWIAEMHYCTKSDVMDCITTVVVNLLRYRDTRLFGISALQYVCMIPLEELVA